MVLALMAGATSAPGATPHRLLPDIVTLRVHSDDLRIESSKGDTLLRLTNRVANKGHGPLEIYPSAKSHGCDGDADPDNDRNAVQRIFLDTSGDRVFERKADTESEHFTFGCDRYDPHAHHWDVFNLARYALLRRHNGRTVAKTSKVAFCTVDSDPAFPWLPGAPEEPYYPQGGCDESSTLGVSVGWADEYYYGLPGQALEHHRGEGRPLLPRVHRRPGEPASGGEQLEQPAQDPDRATARKARREDAAGSLPDPPLARRGSRLDGLFGSLTGAARPVVPLATVGCLSGTTPRRARPCIRSPPP